MDKISSQFRDKSRRTGGILRNGKDTGLRRADVAENRHENDLGGEHSGTH